MINHRLVKATLGLLVFLGVFVLSTPGLAYDPNKVEVSAEETPKDLQGVGVTENLGVTLDLETPFVDSDGQEVTLKKYFNEKPVFMAIIYYNCPNLCHYQLDGMLSSLNNIDWTVGKDFEFLAISMDHNEGPKDAKTKKQHAIKEYKREGSEGGWHFLTGSEENVRKIANQVGFGFRWNEAQKQYAHAAASYLVSPQAVVTRYLYGIEYDKKTLKLSLLEASSGKIGNVVDRLIFYCFQFDPKKNKYTLYALNIMKAGATLTILLLSLFLVPVWLRAKKEKGALK